MKYLTQVVLPIVIVVGIIGVLTFIMQYSGPRKTPPPRPERGVAAAEVLVFSRRVPSWTDDTSDYPVELEVQTPYHCDYRYENGGMSLVRLGLEHKSCACAEVSVAVAGPGEGDLPPVAPERWQKLGPDAAPTVVPGATPAGPGVAWVRLSWQGRKVGPERLTATLWNERTPGERLPPLRREEQVRFAPALRVTAPTVKVKDLKTVGQQETVEFNCWSTTRTAFPLTVQPAKPCGNIVCATQPLTAQQCQELSQAENVLIRCGYRVRVTVHERRDGTALDLGSFQHKLLLTGPPDRPPAEVTLTGIVRGEVAVLSAEDADGIQLRTFPAQRGTEKTVTLTADAALGQLQLESWTPDTLDVRLGPARTVDGRQRWDLIVKVPPRAVVGALPEDSAVILRVQGDPPRRMRLPLSGQGTQ